MKRVSKNQKLQALRDHTRTLNSPSETQKEVIKSLSKKGLVDFLNRRSNTSKCFSELKQMNIKDLRKYALDSVKYIG